MDYLVNQNYFRKEEDREMIPLLMRLIEITKNVNHISYALPILEKAMQLNATVIDGKRIDLLLNQLSCVDLVQIFFEFMDAKLEKQESDMRETPQEYYQTVVLQNKSEEEENQIKKRILI